MMMLRKLASHPQIAYKPINLMNGEYVLSSVPVSKNVRGRDTLR